MHFIAHFEAKKSIFNPTEDKKSCATQKKRLFYFCDCCSRFARASNFALTKYSFFPLSHDILFFILLIVIIITYNYFQTLIVDYVSKKERQRFPRSVKFAIRAKRTQQSQDSRICVLHSACILFHTFSQGPLSGLCYPTSALLATDCH